MVGVTSKLTLKRMFQETFYIPQGGFYLFYYIIGTQVLYVRFHIEKKMEKKIAPQTSILFLTRLRCYLRSVELATFF